MIKEILNLLLSTFVLTGDTPADLTRRPATPTLDLFGLERFSRLGNGLKNALGDFL